MASESTARAASPLLGVKGGPSARCVLDTVETEVGEIKRIDERIERANRIFFVDPVVEALGRRVDCEGESPSKSSKFGFNLDAKLFIENEGSVQASKLPRLF